MVAWRGACAWNLLARTCCGARADGKGGRATATVVVALWVMLLWGCGESRQEQVAQWLATQADSPAPAIAATGAIGQPQPAAFDPARYTRADGPDPFALARLTGALPGPQAVGDARLIERHRQRLREPLEAFPLDAIEMVGYLARPGTSAALLRVQGHLHHVRVGQYIGLNHGQIRAVLPTQLRLVEVVQEASGVWVERPVVLELQLQP